MSTLPELLDAYRDAIEHHSTCFVTAKHKAKDAELAARRAIVQYVESLKEKLNAKG